METREIILVICLLLILVVNIFMIILKLRDLKKKHEGVTLDVDDYLTLILQQIDQLAGDAIDVASVKREDFADDDAYSLALLTVVKEKVLTAGEEYGLSSNILRLIDETKLEQYLLDSINMIVKKNELTAESTMTTAQIETAVTEPASESAVAMTLGNNEITDAINNFYEDSTDSASDSMADEV